MTEAEKLAALDRAARNADESGDGELAYALNRQFAGALMTAYRANQLVLIGTDAVEVVARALEKSLAFDVESDVYAGELTHEERCKLARAALAALGVK